MNKTIIARIIAMQWFISFITTIEVVIIVITNSRNQK